MDDEKTPLKNNSNKCCLKSSAGDKELEEIHGIIEEPEKILKSMSEYEIKLIKGLMRGFANILILWLISKKRQHGYEIMTRLHESSLYKSKMPSASKIYPVLHDLEKNELIKGFWEQQGKRKVKYYEITDEGKKTLYNVKKLAQNAQKNHSSLWMEFMKDLVSNENNKE